MIGSPAGLFAALRGVNPTKGRPLGSPAAGMMCPGSAPGGLPVCRRMYNVFHPFDPVAYRMEPLIQKDDCPRPQLVPYHRGGRKLKMNIVDAGENVAKTMDKVAAAFTFTFRRSKEEALEPVRIISPAGSCAVGHDVCHGATTTTRRFSGLTPCFAAANCGSMHWQSACLPLKSGAQYSRMIAQSLPAMNMHV